MKKKSVNLITAVGVLVILSGAYVGVKAYVARQDAAEESSEEEENPEIVSIASADVKSIKFVIDKKEVTFEKDGDSWVKSDETDFPVDQDKIDTLVSSLNSITAERTLENVEDASEYELDQPENTITITTEDGETTVIQIGMENESTNQEYIDLNKDSSTVYVVSNSTFSSFEGGLYDFAKSGTFPTVDSSTVSKISVNGKDSSYTVEKDENNFWNITSDGETDKADSAKATSLASALSSMAYASYVNYNCTDDKLSQYGLDKPYAEITADYQEEVEKDSTDEKNSTDGGNSSDKENSTDEENESENGSEEATEASEDGSEKDGNEDSEIEENSSLEDSDESVDENSDENTAENSETLDEDSEAETELVDKELVIQVGDQSSDGGRYVRINDSSEIYTISEDSLDTFLGKTNADFWDLTVSYLSVNNLETLDVNYEGEDYIVNVSRETSEDEAEDGTEDTTEETEEVTEDVAKDTADDADTETAENVENTDEKEDTEDNADRENTETAGNTENSSSASNSTSVTLSYTLNGNELDSTTFTAFYNKLINMTAQKRLTDEFKSNADPEMAVKFTDVDGKETNVEYYSYDTNYYAAVTDGKVYLVNKMTVKELFQAFETVTGNGSEEDTSSTDSSVEGGNTDSSYLDETEVSEGSAE